MNHVIDSCVKLDILSNTLLLGDIFVFRTASTVNTTLNGKNDLLDQCLNNWHKDVQYHGTANGITNNSEPGTIEIAQTSTNKTIGQWALSHASVDNEEDNGCVYELHPEYDFCGTKKSLGLLVVPQTVYDVEAALPYDYIEDNNRNLKK